MALGSALGGTIFLGWLELHIESIFGGIYHRKVHTPRNTKESSTSIDDVCDSI